MGQINQDLYNFIMENKSSITDEWLTAQIKEDPNFFNSKMEAYLREENGALIEAISCIYIQEKDQYREYINHRASKVAERRAKEGFPLHENIRGFSNARKVYWNAIQRFIRSTELSVTVENVAIWTNDMNTAFDYIIQNFARYYHEHTKEILAAQQALISALSSPVIPIKKGIGVLPLIGAIDQQRAAIILESTLKQSTEKGLSILFIDLSAVPILDKVVAQQLYQLLLALKLVGVEAIFSGIRPELAQTAISLGTNFTGIKTYSTLSQALQVYSID